MIVEFIGATGAGKTTLISEVQQRLSKETQAVSSLKLAQDILGLEHVTNPTVENVIQDVAGLPFFLTSLHRHRAFLALSLRTLGRQRSYRLSSVNYLRSIVRKIGMYEIAKQRHRERTILVDEGTVLSAHLLFVYTNSACSQGDIERFAGLVPLPDLLVYVKAPVDTLVRRALERSDVRREMRTKNQALVEEYIGRAVAVFDRLVEVERIQERLLIVANYDSTKSERNVVGERLASCILNYKSDGVQTSNPNGQSYATILR